MASFLLIINIPSKDLLKLLFSSLSESGFIPTDGGTIEEVWVEGDGSHLFQRVASFLHLIREIDVSLRRLGFSSLSESGFIPTYL